jgi:hypothetical protein
MDRREPQDAATDEQIARVWHIYKCDGLGETVVANDCQILSGVLSFRNRLSFSGDYVLVRAFAPHDWHDVTLIDTPFRAPIQLTPSWRS